MILSLVSCCLFDRDERGDALIRLDPVVASALERVRKNPLGGVGVRIEEVEIEEGRVALVARLDPPHIVTSAVHRCISCFSNKIRHLDHELHLRCDRKVEFAIVIAKDGGPRELAFPDEGRELEQRRLSRPRRVLSIEPVHRQGLDQRGEARRTDPP